MRVWDIPVNQLCDKHLIAQHHEIHCIYNIITKGLKGFANHPEVRRWRNCLNALGLIHFRTEKEMFQRSLHPNSPLTWIPTIIYIKPNLWQPIEKQKEILKAKGCSCRI